MEPCILSRSWICSKVRPWEYVIHNIKPQRDEVRERKFLCLGLLHMPEWYIILLCMQQTPDSKRKLEGTAGYNTISLCWCYNDAKKIFFLHPQCRMDKVSYLWFVTYSFFLSKITAGTVSLLSSIFWEPCTEEWKRYSMLSLTYLLESTVWVP